MAVTIIDRYNPRPCALRGYAEQHTSHSSALFTRSVAKPENSTAIESDDHFVRC